MSPQAIARRLGNGSWIVVHPGVYRLAAYPDTWRGRLLAAQLACGDDAFVSHRSAGAILGIDGCEETHIEIATYNSRTPEGSSTHRLALDDRPRVRSIDGFRVPTVERTIVDICAITSPWFAGEAMDDCLRTKKTTLDRLWKEEHVHSRRGRTGVVVFRALLDARDNRDGLVRTKFEAKMLRILREIDSRSTKADHPVPVGSRTYKLDFALPKLFLGIECHSVKWHLGQEKWKKDLKRDRQLASVGWEVLYFTWDEVNFDPEGVAMEIRAFIRSRSSRSNPNLPA